MENKSFDEGEENRKIQNSSPSRDEASYKDEEVSIRMREPKSRMNLEVQQINSSKDELITEQKGNIASRAVVRVRGALFNIVVRHRQKVHFLLTAIAFFSILCYFGAVFWHWDRQGRKPLKWCTGNGFLLVMFIIFSLAISYYKAIKPICSRFTCNKESSTTFDMCIRIFKQLIFYCLVIVLLVYLIYDAFGETYRLISVGGMLTFIFIGFFSSKHPNEIKWRTVLMGIFVQITMGMLTIRWEFGRNVFLCIGNRTETFLRFGYEGAAFAFGNYIVHELHVFAFMSLSVIYFMGMIIEMLFYLGWIQRMCFNLGWAIQNILGTTIIESVNAVTTVFLGMSEAPLLYRPYLKDLTQSELHAVMAGGFSTVAGTVFAAYTALGVNPAYLITASIMAAPAALCFAKLLYPETEVSKTTSKNFVYYKSEERSIIDAACKGAISGISLIAGVIATIIASVSLVAFFSSTLQWFASLVGVEGFTFQYLVGKILLPIPYLMGVNPEQCEHVAKLIGIKLSLNEFIAYEELGKMKKIGLLTPRSEAMATFALCSFANPGSLACFIAVLVSLCPNQKQNIGRVALRALISGATTSMLTACVAGMLMPEGGFGDLGCTDCSNRTSYTVL